ncbi:hypothetical protein OMP43_22800 [Sphingomonas sp. CBMAI 2297]|uniref:hypothetical protein n=1 Tax=Sphingomonas sp. CBMAI 2297 TaxID=2991720 RepID=UPI0024542F24|nr:hypothetical protein [Sphingomonas sp. CBMAI 2297]MDH4746857.1 hypothetical protein [Sphingomonas sp. CBMAI 2297]
MSARLSVRAFAERAGCDEKQVRRAIEKGLLTKGDDGKLSADDVDGNWRKPNRRGVEKIAAKEVRTIENVRTPPGRQRKRATVRTDETAEEAAERIVAEGGLLSLAEALRLKENYLARHQQLSYDLKAGTVVLIEEVQKGVGAEYAGVRKKLLAIPAERAPAVHRLKTVAEVEDFLRSVIVEALEELTLDGSPPG